MIRATRGRSMDGWMDGWSRPNHMPSHLDALQTPGPVAFRRFVGRLHSVAKQASFNIALPRVFCGFGSNFGRFWEAKMDAEIDFPGIFFDVFFECVFASILDRFLEARNLKNHCFSTGKSMIFIKLTLSEKYRKIVNLGFVFGLETVEKSINKALKTMPFLECRFWSVLFGILPIFTRFWESLGVQKIAKNRKNSCLDHVWNAFGISKRFCVDFEAIFKDLGWIFKRLFRKFSNFFDRLVRRF